MLGVLPRDVLQIVLDILSPQSILSLQFVCRYLWQNVKQSNKYLQTKAIECAAYNGELKLLQWMDETLRWHFSKSVSTQAAYNGQIHVLEWMRDRGYTFDTSDCRAAASNGQNDALQWLKDNKCPYDHAASAYASLNGHLHTLIWLRDIGYPWNSSSDLSSSSFWEGCVIKQNEKPWNIQTCSFAAKGGHLDVLKWLRQNGCPWSDMTSLRAAESGQTHILQYLKDNKCLFHKVVCDKAAGNGHLHTLIWLRERGYSWSENTCAVAAENGHLGTLRWAIEHGCPYDATELCIRVAIRGRVDILQYLKEIHCQWTDSAIVAAFEHGQMGAVQFLKENM